MSGFSATAAQPSRAQAAIGLLRLAVLAVRPALARAGGEEQAQADQFRVVGRRGELPRGEEAHVVEDDRPVDVAGLQRRATRREERGEGR